MRPPGSRGGRRMRRRCGAPRSPPAALCPTATSCPSCSPTGRKRRERRHRGDLVQGRYPASCLVGSRGRSRPPPGAAVARTATSQDQCGLPAPRFLGATAQWEDRRPRGQTPVFGRNDTSIVWPAATPGLTAAATHEDHGGTGAAPLGGGRRVAAARWLNRRRGAHRAPRRESVPPPRGCNVEDGRLLGLVAAVAVALVGSAVAQRTVQAEQER